MTDWRREDGSPWPRVHWLSLVRVRRDECGMAVQLRFQVETEAEAYEEQVVTFSLAPEEIEAVVEILSQEDRAYRERYWGDIWMSDTVFHVKQGQDGGGRPGQE